MTRVRPGRASDRAALEAAQQALTAPSPSLLAGALTEPGPLDVLVAVPSSQQVASVADYESTVPDEGQPAPPIGYALLVPGPEAVYLPELAVRPEYQGNGHGSVLLRTVLDRSRPAGVVRLTVAATNGDALRFYEQHGFERETRLPNRFDGEDGLSLAYTHEEQ